MNWMLIFIILLFCWVFVIKNKKHCISFYSNCEIFKTKDYNAFNILYIRKFIWNICEFVWNIRSIRGTFARIRKYLQTYARYMRHSLVCAYICGIRMSWIPLGCKIILCPIPLKIIIWLFQKEMYNINEAIKKKCLVDR